MTQAVTRVVLVTAATSGIGFHKVPSHRLRPAVQDQVLSTAEDLAHHAPTADGRAERT